VTTVNLLNSFWGTGPRRYWRVYILAAERSDRAQLAEVEMAATPGGANICTGGVASASSESLSQEASNAFDGDVGTNWGAALIGSPDASAGGWDEWIQYEFPAPVTIREVRLRSHLSILNSAPYAFTILSSPDGVTWTAHSRYFGETGWTTSEIRTFAVAEAPINLSAAPRIWLLEVLENDGGTGGWGVNEIYLAQTAGGASIATGGLVNGTSAFAGTPPANAFDGNTATAYATASGFYLKGFLVYELATGSDLYEWRILNRSGGAASQAPRTFNIKSSVDGYHFTTQLAVVGSSGWSASETRTFVL